MEKQSSNESSIGNKGVESKRVKISTRRVNFDFTIFQHIARGSWPMKISKDLNLSKQRVGYYISSLKDRNLIKMNHQGVWEIVRNYELKESKKSTRVHRLTPDTSHKSFDSFQPDTIRGHAYQFKLELPANLHNWDRREELLQRLNISYEPLKYLFGGGQKIVFKGRKIHLTNNSIIIYEKASYFAEKSEDALSRAMMDVLVLIRSLEYELRANFAYAQGKWKVKPTKQHYALIKNALAGLYNKPKKEKLEVFDGKGLWLLIDNSWNLEELEAVHSVTSPVDSQGIKGWMNSMKATDFKVTPEFVLNSLAENSKQMKEAVELNLFYGEHHKSHVKAIQDLGSGIKELVGLVKELKENKK